MYEIKDSSYSHVSEMVNFMYTGSYDAPAEDPTAAGNANSSVLFHARMAALAEKYLIPSLQNLALSSFKISVDSCKDWAGLLRAIPEVYDTGAEESSQVREILVSRFQSDFLPHFREVGMEDLLVEVSKASPQFSTDLLRALLRSTIMVTCRDCGSVSKHFLPKHRRTYCHNCNGWFDTR